MQTVSPAQDISEDRPHPPPSRPVIDAVVEWYWTYARRAATWRLR